MTSMRTASTSKTQSDATPATPMASKQDTAQSPSIVSNTNELATAPVPLTAHEVANRGFWQAHTMTSMRTASTSKPQSDTAAATPIVSKQANAQSPSVVSNTDDLATTPVPQTDQPSAGVADRSYGQANGNRLSDGSTATLAQPTTVHDSTVANELPQQLLASQLVTDSVQPNAIVADPAERDATPVKQSNPAPSSDAGVAEEVQGSAPATPNGTPQAGADIAAQVAGENFMAPIGPPAANALPSSGNQSQHVGKAAMKEINDAADTNNCSLGSTTDSAKSKATDAVGMASDGSSHEAQNSGQTTQHSQTDPSQGEAVAARVMDSGTSQAQTVVLHAAPNQPATALHSAGGTEDLSPQVLQPGDTPSNELDGTDAAGSSGINAAKLIQTLGETGMSVGMHSSEFGNISIRTSVSPLQMLTQISLDHGDLSQAISSHVSSMQTKLENDYGLHTVIEVNRQGTSSSGESGNSAQRDQKEFVRSVRTENAAVPAESEIGLPAAALVGASDGLRLDIRA